MKPAILSMRVRLKKGLPFAANDETAETELYPEFAETAKKEGFADIAALYKLIAKVEDSHRIIFDYLAGAVKNGTLFSADSPVLWVCGDCGHMAVGEKAWKTCPLCGAEQGRVMLHLPFEGQPRLTGRIFAYLADSILKGE